MSRIPKLNMGDVQEIRWLRLVCGWSLKELSWAFKVTPTHVSFIARNKCRFPKVKPPTQNKLCAWYQ